jgi:hypothetical protein
MSAIGRPDYACDVKILLVNLGAVHT